MNIENDIFKKGKVRNDKLIEYGFKKNKDQYLYSTYILGNGFKVDINITSSKVIGKIYDMDTGDEYTNFRILEGSFSGQVREEYEKVLKDIYSKCFVKEDFISMQANRISQYIKEKYNCDPAFLWPKYDGFGVFKKANNKWFAIIMNINKKLLSGEDREIDIINVKIDSHNLSIYIQKEGFYEAYHMNKKSWISISLDDTVDDSIIKKMIDDSYQLVK